MFYTDRLSIPEAKILEEQQKNYPVDIDKIADMYGIGIVHDVDMNDDLDGYLFYLNKQFTIFVNDAHTEKVKRFTIAHEIAHFLLHKEFVIENGSIDRGRNTGHQDHKEAEADGFAEEMLMPFDTIERAIAQGHDTVQKLAEAFKVSEKVLKKRLGIIS